MILPWLIKLNRDLTIRFLGLLSLLLAGYFFLITGANLPLRELIGSRDTGLGIRMYLDRRELIWLTSTLVLVFSHFQIHRKDFLGYSLTSLLLYLFSIFATIGIMLSRDVFNLFVMIEMFSLAMIGLILARNNYLNALKAFQFLLLNSIAAAMFLLGVALIYRQTGVLNLDELINLASENGTPDKAMAFIMAAISLKLMLFPLNAWAKNLIGIKGGADASYICMMMPMVFIFDLQKLSGLLNGYQVVLLSILAMLTVFVHTYLLFMSKRTWRSSLVFILNAGFALVFALHFFKDSFMPLIVFGTLSSLVKMAVLKPEYQDEEDELSAGRFEPNLNNSILALLIILFIFWIV